MEIKKDENTCLKTNTTKKEDYDAQDHEFIPLISAEDEEAMQKRGARGLLLLSLRNTVLFPGVIPITLAGTGPSAWSRKPTSSSTALVCESKRRH